MPNEQVVLGQIISLISPIYFLIRFKRMRNVFILSIVGQQNVPVREITSINIKAEILYHFSLGNVLLVTLCHSHVELVT